jgi:hypothetical protein
VKNKLTDIEEGSSALKLMQPIFNRSEIANVWKQITNLGILELENAT